MFTRVFQVRLRLSKNYCQFYNVLTAYKISCRPYGVHVYRNRFDMDKVYLRHVRDTEELHISFRYVNKNLQIDRDFNFCRSINERIDDALTRIRHNVEKEILKRAKKVNKKRPKSAVAATGSLAKHDAPLPPEFPTEINIDLLRISGGESIRNITFSELLQGSADGLQLRILDRNFKIFLNRPWVVNVALPSTILAGYLVYPTKLELQFAEPKYCKVSWFRAPMPASGDLQKGAKWEHCGSGLLYTTSVSDVGQYLKIVFTPGNEHGQLGPPVEHVAKYPVENGPTTCPFEQRQLHTKEPLSAPGEMRVVTYNLLADLYADNDYSRSTLFQYCPLYALSIDYRKQLIIKELIGYNADLICLQEVDLKVFDYDLKSVLEAPEHGFCGHIAPKGSCAEGVATFYRSSRFELVEKYVLHLGDNISKMDIFAPIWEKIKLNERLEARICDRNTTLQLSVLKFKQTEQYVILANTHLYFHPDADHIRLLQIGVCLKYIEYIYKQTLDKYQLADEKDVAIIFCGDFNSVPSCGIYQLMTECMINSDHVDWRSNEDEAVKDVTLTQPFKMSSACGTPAYTNFTQLFSDCLDYIFYQSDRLDLLQSVPLPTDDELKADTAIPSPSFPSDHVALIADLKFKQS